jgi:hypothetical protein
MDQPWLVAFQVAVAVTQVLRVAVAWSALAGQVVGATQASLVGVWWAVAVAVAVGLGCPAVLAMSTWAAAGYCIPVQVVRGLVVQAAAVARAAVEVTWVPLVVGVWSAVVKGVALSGWLQHP